MVLALQVAKGDAKGSKPVVHLLDHFTHKVSIAGDKSCSVDGGPMILHTDMSITRLYANVYIRVYAPSLTHAYTHVHAHVYIHVYIHVYARVYTHVYKRVYAYVFAHVYTHVYAHVYTHVSAHVYRPSCYEELGIGPIGPYFWCWLGHVGGSSIVFA